MSGVVRDFNNIETWAVIKLFFLQGKALKEIHAILTETLAYFLPARAKDLSAPLYKSVLKEIHAILTETLACFLPGRAKDLSAPLYKSVLKEIHAIPTVTLPCFLVGLRTYQHPV